MYKCNVLYFKPNILVLDSLCYNECCVLQKIMVVSQFTFSDFKVFVVWHQLI